MSWETAAYLAIAGVGAAATLASKPKPPGIKTPGAPPAPVEGGPETGKKMRRFRPAAQLFPRDEDLRLGSAGRLGL